VFKVRGKLISKAKIKRWTREDVGGNMNALGIGDEIGGAYLSIYLSRYLSTYLGRYLGKTS